MTIGYWSFGRPPLPAPIASDSDCYPRDHLVGKFTVSKVEVAMRLERFDMRLGLEELELFRHPQDRHQLLGELLEKVTTPRWFGKTTISGSRLSKSAHAIGLPGPYSRAVAPGLMAIFDNV